MSKSKADVNNTQNRSTVKARGRNTMIMPKQKVEFHASAARISTFSHCVERTERKELIRFHRAD